MNIDDFKNSFNCYFGVSKQLVVAVDISRKSCVYAVSCSSIIGWQVKEDENYFMLIFDQGEFIQINVKSKIDLQQIIKRLEFFTRGCRVRVLK